jgi:hypothetical protein
MANIVLYERGSLSYLKAVEEAIAELRQQGFVTSDPVLEVCPHPSKNTNAQGKSGWKIMVVAKESYRKPWEVWVFDELEDVSEAHTVEVEVVMDDGPIDPPPTTNPPSIVLEIKALPDPVESHIRSLQQSE